MNSKKWCLGIVALFSILFVKIIPLVTAYNSFAISRGPEDLVQIVIDFFTPFFQAILGYGAIDQFFFERVLLLIVIFVVSAVALESVEMFKARKGVAYIIAAAIAILGARYIATIDVIRGILLPYGVVTIALSIFIPLFVYGFFIHKAISNGAGRKLAWILFAAVAVGLWWTRRDLGDLGDLTTVYQIAIVAIVIAVIFDSKVHQYFGLHEANEAKRAIVKSQIADIEAQLTKLSTITAPSQTTKDVIKHLEQRRSVLATKL